MAPLQRLAGYQTPGKNPTCQIHPPPTLSSLDTSGLPLQPKLVVDMGQVSAAPPPPTGVDDHDFDSRGGRFSRTSQFVSIILTLSGLSYFTTDVEMVKDICISNNQQ